jgi:flagellar motor switch protein FliM
MSSVLSQSEVDALLKGISGGEFDVEEGGEGGGQMGDEEIIPYDLTSQDRIIRGRMPTLEIIHDRFVRMFRLTLSNALRKVVDISVRSTELIKFGEFLKTLPVPSSLNLFRMSPLRGNAIMVLETRLVFTLIDLFFGGTGELEVKAEGRDFSAIEQRMIKRVVTSALEDLQQSWRPVFPVQISFSRSEVNPQFVAIVPHSEVVVVVTFDVEMGRAPMSITLCIPYSMIEPIRAKLNAGFQSDQNEVDTTWLNRFRTNLQSAKVEALVELGRADMNVRDFLNLKVGDIVALDQEVDKPLTVTVEGISKFRGHQGSYKGRQALKVAELVYKPPVVDEILLL